MKNFKVALFTIDLLDGGAQKISMNYLQSFHYDKDIDVRLFVLFGNLEKYEKEININRFKVIKLLYKSKIINKIINVLFPLKQYKLLKKFDPDIIHCHSTIGIGYIIINSILNKHKKVFITLHSNPLRIKGIYYYFAKIAFKLLNFIPVCLNEEQAKMAQLHYGFKNYEILHNGVDFEKIRENIISKNEARKIYNVDENTFVLCACGRLHEVKNYPLMLDILKKVLEERTKAVLLIAGDGTEKESLINYAEKLGIKDNVKFLGNLDNPISLYCASDVFLLTSHSESMSLVLMEAQTCGCKSIISAGVPKESIITNYVISMRENASVEEWANAILTENVTYEKPRFTEADYEVHAISQKCKEMYLKYINKEE